MANIWVSENVDLWSDVLVLSHHQSPCLLCAGELWQADHVGKNYLHIKKKSLANDVSDTFLINSVWARVSQSCAYRFLIEK